MMAVFPRRRLTLFLLLLTFLAVLTSAQDTLPPLASVTAAPASSSATSSGDSTSAASTSDASSTASTSAVPTSSQPALSTTSVSSSTSTNAPVLPGVLPPALIVPNLSGAPFMQKSNLPEGTVFICVGATLGFLGACVIAWRIIVAMALRRSVKRAAAASYASETKSMFGLPSSNGYTRNGYTSVYDSNMSMDDLGKDTSYHGSGTGAPAQHRAGNSARQSRAPNTKGRTPTTSSLFFSPTAGAGAGANMSGRSSTYLPAGFYASGSSAPNAGNNVAQIGGQNYGRLEGISPPESPGLRPASRPGSRPGSTQILSAGSNSDRIPRISGVNADQRLSRNEHDQRRSRLGPSSGNELTLAEPSHGRAPSAYLEELFENHGVGPRERF